MSRCPWCGRHWLVCRALATGTPDVAEGRPRQSAPSAGAGLPSTPAGSVRELRGMTFLRPGRRSVLGVASTAAIPSHPT